MYNIRIYLFSFQLLFVVPSTPPVVLYYSNCALMKIENGLDRNDVTVPMWNCGIYKYILKVKLYPGINFCFFLI